MHLAGQAILKNVNLRVEHHGEETALGVDIRLQLKTHADNLSGLDASLKSFLYTVENKLRIPELEPVKLSSTFENYALHLAAETYEPVTFSKFEIDAEADGVVQISFNAAVSNFESERLPMLADCLLEQGRVVNIDMEPLQADLPL